MPRSISPSATDGWLAMPPLRYRRFWLLLGVAALATVVLLCVVRTPPPLALLPLNDKVVHVGVYAALTALFAQILLDGRARLALVLALLALGLAIECLQGLTATRQFELLDLAANAAGTLLAWRLLRAGGARSVLPWLESRYLACRSPGTDPVRALP